MLRAYVALKHQQAGWLSGGIGTDEPLLEVNVLSLGPKTTINISKDIQGAFSQGSADSNPTSSSPFPVPGVLKMTFLPV